MNHFPLIGISGSVSKNERELSVSACYTNALLTAGAIPVILSPHMDDGVLSACLDTLNGILLAGGNDVDPNRYGDEPLDELGEVNPLRDDFEIRLVKMAAERSMPVLGICRGIQSLNVAMGGTLWQDIPSQYRRTDGRKGLAHSQTRADHFTSHCVTIEKETLLYRVIGEATIRVNTFHHQAVRMPAPCLRVGACASDGLIESVEHPSLPFFLGVQWHPERYFDRDKTAMALFQAFTDAAKAYSGKK